MARGTLRAMRRLLVLLLATLPLCGYAYPDEKPADSMVAAEVQIAQGFWAARGLTGCPDGIKGMFAPSLPDTDGLKGVVGRARDCTVYLRSDFPRFRNYDAGWDGGLLECATVVHEVGHLFGLGHTASGVMAPSPQAPFECRRFVAGLRPPAWAARWHKK